MADCRKINLDKLLITDIGDKYNIGTAQDLFGVEVELEGQQLKTLKESVNKYWDKHQDGSLRIMKPGDDATEYVFKGPYNMENTEKALFGLFEFLNKNPGTKVYDSYRTSIHVHVNCLNESIRTIVNFITLCIIFDELFVSQNGPTRIGNNFCLRSKDAEGQIEDIIQSISKYGSLYNLSQNDRYSSVNFVSLIKFGTIEFRSLECTTDYFRVIHWIKTLQCLKEAARQYENPKEIISKFSRRGPLGFMISHLGDQYGKYAAIPNAHQMLNNGMRLAQDFAYCSEWEQPGKDDPQPRSKLKTTKLEFAQGGPGWHQPEAVNNWIEHVNQQNNFFAAQLAQQPPVPQPQPVDGPAIFDIDDDALHALQEEEDDF